MDIMKNLKLILGGFTLALFMIGPVAFAQNYGYYSPYSYGYQPTYSQPFYYQQNNLSYFPGWNMGAISYVPGWNAGAMFYVPGWNASTFSYFSVWNASAISYFPGQ